MATIFETVESELHLSPEHARELARLHAAGGVVGEKVGTAYLRGFLGRVADIAGLTTGGAPLLAAVDASALTLYPAVLDGATTPDVAPLDARTMGPGCTLAEDELRAENKRRSLERNRRTNWARTIHSAVRGFAKAGGTAAHVDISTITKGELVRVTAALSVGGGATGAVLSPGGAEREAVNRAWKRLDKALASLKATDPADAATAARGAARLLTERYL